MKVFEIDLTATVNENPRSKKSASNQKGLKMLFKNGFD